MPKKSQQSLGQNLRPQASASLHKMTNDQPPSCPGDSVSSHDLGHFLRNLRNLGFEYERLHADYHKVLTCQVITTDCRHLGAISGTAAGYLVASEACNSLIDAIAISGKMGSNGSHLASSATCNMHPERETCSETVAANARHSTASETRNSLQQPATMADKKTSDGSHLDKLDVNREYNPNEDFDRYDVTVPHETKVIFPVTFRQMPRCIQNSVGFEHNETKAIPSIASQLSTIKPSHTAGKTKTISSNLLADLKTELRDKLSGENFHTEKDFYSKFGLAQAIARHTLFEHITLFIIMANAIWMAVDTDYNTADLNFEADPIFLVGEQFFTFYFVFEIMIRFAAFQSKKRCCRELWFLLEVLLVLLMVTENWVLNLVLFLLPSSATDSRNLLSNISLLRMGRLFRLFRLVRVLRILRMIPELLIMVRAIVAAARAVFVTLCLLFLVLFTFGIAFTQLVLEADSAKSYFTDVLSSMNSLALKGALMDSPSDVVSALLQDGNHFGVVLFYVVMILANITIMNMLTAMLCECISSISESEKAVLQTIWLKSVVQEVLAFGDSNDDYTITQHEFFEMLRNEGIISALSEIGIDVSSLPDLVDFFFSDKRKLSFPGAECAAAPGLTLDEFMTLLLQLRSTNVATVKDLTDLRKWLSQKDSSGDKIHEQRHRRHL